ncbi:hypothetical protein [Pseudomonas gessardii]|uniref:hypothetical protein n=1 Tax=Pseudomonas gessardii TaxID=78544 RepID=UPI0018D73F3B|nr:hypothetical protein [Pseudomonas gessardii]MBH3421432.1 hypothetical protein [Pseudomonas gessardii]
MSSINAAAFFAANVKYFEDAGDRNVDKPLVNDRDRLAGEPMDDKETPLEPGIYVLREGGHFVVAGDSGGEGRSDILYGGE